MTKIKFDRNVFNIVNNEEYYNLVNTIFARLDNASFEEPHVLDDVGRAKRHLDGITAIATRTNFHGNTELMAKLGEERRLMIMGLSYAIKSELYAETEAKRKAARMVYIWIRHERKLISKPRVEGQTGMVNRLNAEVQSRPELLAALEQIHVIERFEKIVELTKEIEGMLIARNHDVKTKPVSMELPREKCNHDMEIMLNTLAGIANSEGHPSRAEYHNLCLELRGYMTSAKAKVSLRRTLSAKGKNVDLDGAEAPEREMETQGQDVPTGEIIEPGIYNIPGPDELTDTDDLTGADLSANGADSELDSEM